jgi:glycosyltransferase involved in cell wall biosynthesis
MALDTPVVCSDSTCLPDIAGDAALVLALDRGAWADVPDEVARRRAALVAAGRERVALFTTAVSGRALAESYGRALNG